jgi:transcription factor TFIIIB component B''
MFVAGDSHKSFAANTLLFKAVQQFGDNFELVSMVLPGRDRKACKNKFKAEDKKNPARIQWCLENRIPWGMSRIISSEAALNDHFQTCPH